MGLALEHSPRMRLPVVEDNDDLAQLLLKGLGTEGFAADVMATAGEAQAALARHVTPQSCSISACRMTTDPEIGCVAAPAGVLAAPAFSLR